MDENRQHIYRALKFAGVWVMIMWLVHIYKVVSGHSLSFLGIFPREMDGLIGIFTAPFVHGSWEHLFSNSLPLFMLSFLVVYFYPRIAMIAFTTIYIITGFLVWFLAAPAYHIGASGVVYGLVAFVFWTGIFRRNIKSIVLGLSVLVLYSGYFMGIVPFKEGVSWESHLLGGITGILIAFLFKNSIEKDEEEKADPWQDEHLEASKYFLTRDTFDLTFEDRQAILDAQREAEKRAQELEDNNNGV